MKLIFTLTLLTTFSMVNALTKFGACPVDPAPASLTVTLNPDPIVAGKSLDITVSGKLNVAVVDPIVVTRAAFLDPGFVPIAPVFTVEFCKCKDIKCPLEAGTEFSTVLTVDVPSDLGEGTTLDIDVFDGLNFLACALSDPIS